MMVSLASTVILIVLSVITCGEGLSQAVRTSVQLLVERLGLMPHPEGGFFSENWRSERNVTVSDPDFRVVRSAGTSMYYLLEEYDFSAWHRLKEEEIFYWHAGGKTRVHTINKSGTLTTIILCDVLQDDDCVYEAIKPDSTWMAIEPVQGSGFVLIGDAAFPGFDFRDWELGLATDLIRQFPAHRDIILRLTRQE